VSCNVIAVIEQYQFGPIDVVNRLVELIEAETTTENNLMPPEIRDFVKAQINAC